MRGSFLIGDFLPGYTRVFKYNQPEWGTNTEGIAPSSLAGRFRSRSTKFETKSQGYGLALQAGLAGALVFILLAFRIPFSSSSEFVIEEVQQELVAMEEIQQTQQVVKPPPPPRPVVPIAVPDDELIEDIELDLDMSLDLEEEVTVITPPPPAEKEEEDSEPELFMVVENPPKIIGGLASLNASLEYPRVALQSGVEGNVVVQVVVNIDGTPSDPQIARSASPLLEQAAVNAVMQQRFEPGKQRGRAVRTIITIPVRFRLKS